MAARLFSICGQGKHHTSLVLYLQLVSTISAIHSGAWHFPQGARGLLLELFTQYNVPFVEVVQLSQGAVQLDPLLFQKCDRLVYMAGASDEFPTSHQCVYFGITWEVRLQQIQSIDEGARRALQFPNEKGHVAQRLLLLLHLELWPKSLQSMTAAVTAQDVH